jgi:hypothetical protein
MDDAKTTVPLKVSRKVRIFVNNLNISRSRLISDGSDGER